jgi:PTS system mannose-specific IIB component/fructoselysine and glucoselysine-specific PTS system IIB component
MTLDLLRIDDRLIHGQVVVGWGQPCEIGFFVLVDDAIAQAEWEQELYRMGTPPEMAIEFVTVAQAVDQLPRYQADSRVGMLLTGDIETMDRLTASAPVLRQVTIGGMHMKPGRVQRMRFVFLSADEEARLLAMADRGLTVVAQDVPSAPVVPLEEVLRGDGTA